MKKAKIKIAGKNVDIAYCYATEMNFTEIAGISFEEYFNSDNTNKHRGTAILIIAAITAAYPDAEAPVTMTDILTNATPAEIVEASNKVMELRTAWYAPEPGKKAKETKPKGDKEKN